MTKKLLRYVAAVAAALGTALGVSAGVLKIEMEHSRRTSP